MKYSSFCIYVFSLLLLCGLAPARVCAEDVSVTATVDKTTVSLDDYIMLTVAVEGTRAEPMLSGLDDFKFSSRGSSSQVRFINGRISSSKEFTFLLQPVKPGTFTIGPFSVVHKKKTYTSDTITLTIVKNPVGATGIDPDANRAVFVTAGVDNQNPYAHEQLIYSFKFYRRIQVGKANLTAAPDFEGCVSERLGKEREYQSVIKGQTYAVTELRWALFPVKSGVLTIGETVLDCELVVRERSRRRGTFNDPFFDDSFFGFGTRTEHKTLRTEPITVMVQPLPAVGRPEGFTPLVGDFELNGKLSDASVHAGDSATLTLRLHGNGNMRSMQTIDVPPMPNVKVYDDKPVFEDDQSHKKAAGTLIVKKAIVPMEEGTLVIPAVSVAYFSPTEKKYTTARTGPFTLSVLPAQQPESLRAVVPTGPVASKEDVKVLGRDILPIYTGFDVLEKTSEPRLTLLYYVLAAAPVCVYVLFIGIYSIWFRRQSDSARVRARSAWPRFSKNLPKLRSILKETGNDFSGEAARALREFIGDMLGVTGSALTSAEIRELLAAEGIGAELVLKIQRLLEQCDAGRYGIAAYDASAQQQLFEDITRAARELHRSR
jgi:hypothetical protein